MNEATESWNDQRLDQILGALLRIGVLLSASIVMIGGGIFLWRHGAEPMPSYREFRGEQAQYRNISAIIIGAAEFRGRGLIQFGLLVLIATPVARVVYSVFAFAVQRDYLYVAVTLIVLIVLLYSLLTGGA